MTLNARAVLLIGRDAPLIERALKAAHLPAAIAVERCATLEQAVARAAQRSSQPSTAMVGWNLAKARSPSPPARNSCSGRAATPSATTRSRWRCSGSARASAG